MEQKVIITIAREYGSGGKTIGKALAKELGIPCYDRDVIRLASEDSGIAERLFGRVDEQLKRNVFDIITNKTYDSTLIPPESDEFTSNDNLFNYQVKIMKELAAKGSCVFIGRCADDVLKDEEYLLRVFIHADEEFCVKQAMERHSMTEREVRSYIKKIDKHRGDFYKYYTGKNWTDAKNYDLCLNTADLGFDKCVEIIKNYVKVRWSE